MSFLSLLGFFGKQIYLQHKKKNWSLTRTSEVFLMLQLFEKVWDLSVMQVSYRTSPFNSACVAITPSYTRTEKSSFVTMVMLWLPSTREIKLQAGRL